MLEALLKTRYLGLSGKIITSIAAFRNQWSPGSHQQNPHQGDGQNEEGESTQVERMTFRIAFYSG